MKKYDIQIALLFALLTVVFFSAAIANQHFFNWVFERHQNQMSWYIRPLFIIPYCYFAYKRSWAGISITLCCLFTSMFWFSKPEIVSEEVKTFLQFEKEWLFGPFSSKKLLLMLAVPISLWALGLSFWKRSLWMGLGVIVLMATGKIIWSIMQAGDAGKSILVPAIIGLLVCGVLVFYGFKRLENSHRKS